MKLLLHICCGPCSIYPVKILRRRGYELTGHWYNPNIHPYREYRKRLTTLEEYAEKIELPLFVHRDYEVKDFLRKVVFREQSRCVECYRMRLEATAKKAAQEGFAAFSSTLFYSKYQNHDLLRSVGEKAAEKYGVSFLYEDFSVGWEEGITESIEEGMYRQTWCGCIYSEQERYDNRWKKRLKKRLKQEQNNAADAGYSDEKQREIA